jgi:hypothetical protein
VARDVNSVDPGAKDYGDFANYRSTRQEITYVSNATKVWTITTCAFEATATGSVVSVSGCYDVILSGV